MYAAYVFSLKGLGETSAKKLILQGYLAAKLVLLKFWDSGVVFLHLHQLMVYFWFFFFSPKKRKKVTDFSHRLFGKLILRGDDSFFNDKCIILMLFSGHREDSTA